MNKERIGEIALILMKNQLAKDGIKMKDYHKELGVISEETGVSLRELFDFMRVLIEELLEETFPEK